MPHDLLNSMKQTLAAHEMLAGHPRLLVAVSGGADSMALLHLLHRARLAAGVAHFDHQTRNGDSALDAQFTAEAARELGLPFFATNRPIEVLASESGESFEMVARRERYAFLIATAHENGFEAVATGHQADDQAETVLMRLIRGASPTGLAGIPPVREEQGVRFIRPLLDSTREDIVHWLGAEGIAWREDASNGDRRFARNRIRRDLLPLLARDYNPAVSAALNRLARLQRMDERLLDRLSEDALNRCRDAGKRLLRPGFRALDPALQHRAMAACIREAGGEATWECVARAVDFARGGGAGKQVDLGNGVALFAAADHCVFAPVFAPVECRDLILPIPGDARGFGKTFRCRHLDGLPDEPLSRYCHAGRQVFAGSALEKELAIRQRYEGDHFRPMGMAGTRKLKDVFNSLGLTRPERDRQLLVTSGGAVIWIVGHAISQNVAVTEGSQNLIEITVE